MGYDCHNPRMTAVCEEELKSADTSTVPAAEPKCKEWSVCLPFGGRIQSDGRCVEGVPPSAPPEDGIYDKIVVENGCIVGAEKGDIPLYTAAPCAPVAGNCNETGGGAAIQPSTLAGNLYKLDSAGRPLVKLTVQSGDGISVRGSGTANDPMVIKTDLPDTEGVVATSGNTSIDVSGAGVVGNPLVITHAAGQDGVYNGMKFDGRGHLIGYTAPTTQTVKGLAPGDGIDIQTGETGISTIAIAAPAHALLGVHQLGGFEVQLDTKNRIFNITQKISIPAGVYHIGDKDIEINTFGSIESIVDTHNHSVLFHKQFLGADTTADMREQIGHFTLRFPSRLRVTYRTLCVAANANRMRCQLNLEDLPLLQRFAAITGLSERIENVGSTTSSDTRSITYVTEYDETYIWMSNAVYSSGQHEVRFIIPDLETFDASYNALVTVEAVAAFED